MLDLLCEGLIFILKLWMPFGSTNVFVDSLFFMEICLSGLGLSLETPSPSFTKTVYGLCLVMLNDFTGLPIM